MSIVITARNTAFLALEKYFIKGVFLFDAFEDLKRSYVLETRDLSLAFEIATGVVRHKRTLDSIAEKLHARPKKRREKILLRILLYQLFYLSKVPLYAIADSIVQLAKQVTSPSFASYLNALVRKIDKNSIEEKLLVENGAVRYSYTDYFFSSLIDLYGLEKANEIASVQNIPPLRFARKRPGVEMVTCAEEGDNWQDAQKFYIQNEAQVKLYSQLALSIEKKPVTILDLCASPGGKTILLHDLFQGAKLFANDASETRIQSLIRNLDRCAVAAEISCCEGTLFPEERKFDLVVVDAPCSNSGCLYKCPEARWRLELFDVQSHKQKQIQLLLKATSLVAPGGSLIYSTCSILTDENEGVLESVPSWKVKDAITYLPTTYGNEGGFAALLQLR